MKITIENLPSCQIAYIRRVGEYGAGLVGQHLCEIGVPVEVR